MNILMLLTLHDQLGNTGKKTGFWLEEFAAPQYVFKDAGARITLASPLEGQPPLGAKSDAEDAQTDDTRRFKQDADAQRQLARTVKLAEIDSNTFDAVFYPGGHGPLWDPAQDPASISLIDNMYAAGKPVVAVCRAPGALCKATGQNGKPLVEGLAVTGFINSEEEAAQLTQVVPFLIEAALKRNGGRYIKAADFQPHMVTTGNLITGQNPASPAPAAQALV